MPEYVVADRVTRSTAEKLAETDATLAFDDHDLLGGDEVLVLEPRDE